ncbi:Rib/alpha-like domain-containing protein, partial [Streptococcus infantis]|uniref:Rib/alpha-like domain-containing protein n=2 Tax=Streptococcus TaxID=1301 RepID=UPI0039C3DAEA
VKDPSAPATDADKNTPTAKDQTVKPGDKPSAKDSIGNVGDLPKGTTVEFKTPVDTTTPGDKGTTVVVTYPDGSKDEVPVKVTVKDPSAPATDAGKNKVTDPTVTPVTDPSNLTDAEKAKVAEEVKKSNPTVTDVKVGKDGTTTVTYPDGTTAVIPADKTVKKSSDKVKESDGVKNPSVTPVTDPSNLTDAEKAKVADEVKKANPTAKDIKVNKDGSVVVTFEDGSVAVIPAEKSVTAANQDSPAQAPAKKAGAKELPNTGTEQSSASLALALLAAATGGLLFAKKREEEE